MFDTSFLSHRVAEAAKGDDHWLSDKIQRGARAFSPRIKTITTVLATVFHCGVLWLATVLRLWRPTYLHRGRRLELVPGGLQKNDLGAKWPVEPMSGSALPPDVRRWLCPADSCQIILGLCPWSGLSRFGFMGPKAGPGA